MITFSTYASKRTSALLYLIAAVLSISIAPVTVKAAAAPIIRIVSGAEQRTTYAAAFPKPLQVQITDSSSKRGMARAQVNFIASPGIGLSATAVVADDSGFASVNATGLLVGTSSVEVTLEGSPRTRIAFEGLKVAKATLIIVPDNLNSTVGQIPALTRFTLSGFVNGETAQSARISGAPLLTTVATSRSRDANYAIKGWPGTLLAPNYNFVAGFGTLSLSGTASDAATSRQSSAEDSSDNGVAGVTNMPDSSESIRPALILASPAGGTNSIANTTGLVRSTALPSAQNDLRNIQKIRKPLVLPAGLKAPGSN